MAIILSLFFDDYGLPSIGLWIFCFLAAAVSGIFLMLSLWDDDVKRLPKFISGILAAMFCCLIVSFLSINSFETIPASGTHIQKANLKRCTAFKPVNLGNIWDIMKDCRDYDHERKFKEKIESLDK